MCHGRRKKQNKWVATQNNDLINVNSCSIYCIEINPVVFIILPLILINSLGIKANLSRCPIGFPMEFSINCMFILKCWQPETPGTQCTNSTWRIPVWSSLDFGEELRKIADTAAQDIFH